MRGQPGVVGAVAGAHGGFALLEQAGEVEVRLAVRERHRRVPERARVGDVGRVLGGVVPGRVDAQHPLRAAVAERRLLGADARHRPAAVADDHQRVVRRAAVRPVDRRVDRGVREPVQVERLPVAAHAGREERVQRALEVEVLAPARSCPPAGSPARAGAAWRARPRPGRPPTCRPRRRRAGRAAPRAARRRPAATRSSPAVDSSSGASATASRQPASTRAASSSG